MTVRPCLYGRCDSVLVRQPTSCESLPVCDTQAILADPGAPPALAAAASQQLEAVVIAYQAEARAGDATVIKVACVQVRPLRRT